MTTLKSKIALALLAMVSFTSISIAQTGTLEMTSLGSSNVAVGPSINPIVVNFREDITNATAGTHFKTYTPALNVTASFANQQYNTTYGNISTGIAFGGGNTASTGGTTQQSASNPVYNALGASLVEPPQNGMFVSSPTGLVVASNFQLGGRGVGQDPEAIQGGTDDDNGGADDYNFGMAVFTNVEPLFDANLDKAGRYYYGDIVFKFSRPVKNPVIHIGGLGGSYNYQPIGGGARQISYFSTEMELQGAFSSSTRMSGNEYFTISGNNILNSSATPNGGSYDDGTLQGGFLTYGAATGSVRINGTVTELVYKVYVRGSAASQFNFSQPQSAISQATRRPLNGDLFYVGISLDKPTQQISGYVFNDKDGLNDAGGGDITKSAGVVNPKTNVGGLLYANLVSGSTVIATTPISADGSYLFDNVPVGSYSVQLTTSSTGAFGASLPTGWVNTGEFVGNTPGSDILINGVNGTSVVVPVGSGDIKVEVNFGIERLPESVDFLKFIPTPLLNAVITLNTANLTPLSGSDPEDKPVTGTLDTKTIKITTLPTTSTLIYAGVNVFAGQVIPNYNPALLQIQFTNPTPAGETQFKYAYVDAAGNADPTPATYIIRWPNPGTLDITLADFSATKNNCTANLVWKTSSEVNSDKFEIEVSTNSNTNFKSLQSVVAKGNSTTKTSYEFNFAMQSDVTYYFRLKMFSKNGNYTYSVIRTISCQDVKAEISIRPNPVVDNSIHVYGMAKGKNTIMVLSTEGKIIASLSTTNTNDDVNVSNLKAGEYLVKILNENGTSTVKKIVKY